ncbi:hypothetical protein C8J56DRAFT_869498 [Mycena floridula]|nr:hypothetical protein C8J56DRAFT_869498 [Mycena floridula]
MASDNESFRETVDVASAIKNILDSYPENGILRELLQNSDDAQAKSQIFILDRRTHPNSSLVDPSLCYSQGPALLAFNDTLFSDSDWDALRKINNSNKTQDETKTGKYGLGIRACYHVTENIQVLSGSYMVIFDPHEQFAPPFTGGCRTSFVNKGAQYDDQLSAFQVPGVIDFVADAPFKGTIVRLALRTPDQAAKSRIKRSAVVAESMHDYFVKFIAEELELAMLFLKNITSIQLKEVTSEGDIIDLAEVQIQDPEIARKRSFIRGADTIRSETFKCPIIFRSQERAMTTTWRIFHSIQSREEAARVMGARLSYSVEERLLEDKLFAHVALAFPLDGPRIDGRLFTLLPLPIPTDFPLHIHSIFALTPDRQSLRNRAEKGFNKGSRELFLVEWNNTLFQHFIPRAWIELFSILILQDNQVDIWSAWPPESSSQHLYWGTMLHDILAIAGLPGPQQPEVFPTSTQFVSLSSALLNSPGSEEALIAALARLDIAVITPPMHIFRALSTLQPKRHVLVEPSNVRNRLLDQLARLSTLTSDEDKTIFLDYLIHPSRPSWQNIFQLPILPLADGSHLALAHNTPSTFLVSEQEACLFNQHQSQMIPTWRLSSHVREALSTHRHNSLAPLAHYNVTNWLGEKFPSRLVDEYPGTEAEIAWLQDFWSWMAQSLIQKSVANGIGHLHLLPTRRQMLRKVKCRIALPIDDDNDAMSAWQQLGLPFLHQSIPKPTITSLGFGLPANHIPYLLDFLDTSLIPSLDSHSSSCLKQHILRSLPSFNFGQSWSRVQIDRYVQLPIFPQRQPNLAGVVENALSKSIDGNAVGNRVYVRISDECPVPVISGTTLLDVSSSSQHLFSPLPPSGSRPLEELGVLRLAVNHFSVQSEDNLDAIASRFIARLSDLPDLVETLRNTTFVPVANLRQRFKPADLVEPQSILGPLYAGESGKFPVANSRLSDMHLYAMQINQLFAHKLSPLIISNRVDYTARHLDHQKAEILLELLDDHWEQSFAGVADLSTRPWMPAKRPGESQLSTCSANQCRDQLDAHLFDLVLPVVPRRIRTYGLRQALGWTNEIPFRFVHDQLLAVLNSTCDATKISDIILHLSRRDISSQDLQHLKESLQGRKWIPVVHSGLEDTEHSLLSETSLSPMFDSAKIELRSGDAQKFLLQMGCADSPSLDSLLDVIGSKVGQNMTDSVLGDVIRVLETLSDHSPLDDVHREHLLVPDFNKQLQSPSNLYFPDVQLDTYTAIPDNIFPVHDRVSKSLAANLGLQFASSLALGDQNEDEDDEDMAEDLWTRIDGVLQAYGLEYAFNEFFANAADAKATEFNSLLDETPFDSGAVISPAMSCLQGPSLILHNNGIFTKSDFIGLRRVGKGGKMDDPTTIGRHGLGALSLFHFTQVAFIVSGDCMLILDPSGNFLPPKMGGLGRKRTALLISLPNISRRYPDQIAPFEGLFGFSSKLGFYNGTIFRLPFPLDSPRVKGYECLDHLNRSWFTQARNALFFTCLTSISAYRREPKGLLQLWRVSAARSAEILLRDNEFSCYSLDLSVAHLTAAPEATETWTITKSTTSTMSVPRDCATVLHSLKLDASDARIVVRLALPAPRSASNEQSFYLFSSLRLPEKTSLPLHIDAQFALASDRRNIRFDPADSSGFRVPEAAYNHWILKVLVTPLYLWSIYVAHQREYHIQPSGVQWWPLKLTDEKSQTVGEAVFEAAPSSSEKLFRTREGLVAPWEAVFNVPKHPQLVTSLLNHVHAAFFVALPPQIVPLMSVAELTTVTADYLVNSLRSGRDFRTHWSFREDGVGKSRVLASSETLINFILPNVSSTPRDLPILLSADQQLIPLPSSSQPVLFWRPEKPPKLFPLDRFIHWQFQRETVEIMQKASVNVAKFDAAAIVVLLRARILPGDQREHSGDDRHWIRDFWRFVKSDSEAEQVDISAFDDLPMIEVEGIEQWGTYVSLQYCLRKHNAGEMIRAPRVLNDPLRLLLRLLRLLGVDIVRDLTQQVQEKLPAFSFEEVIKCLSARVSLLGSLSEQERQQIADWIFINMPSVTTKLKQTLRDLPVWPAWRNNALCFVTANQLKMLPEGTNATPFLRFMGPDVAVCQWASQLVILQQEALTPDQLFASLSPPNPIPAADLHDYRNLLQIVLRWSRHHNLSKNTQLSVPDGQLQMRGVGELYDSTVELFVAALGNRPQMFVHPDMNDLQLQLRAWGLQDEINYDTFLQCATAISEDHSDVDFDIHRAEVVYDCYNDTLPWLSLRPDQWRSLDVYAFIPSSPVHRPIAPYETIGYGQPLTPVVSPSKVLRREFESIAWTQRRRISVEPSHQLLQAHPNLGVPQVAEVVAHLRAIALVIAPQRLDSSLLSDLESTYTWLTGKSVTIAASEALFLNVDDPVIDYWEWCPAANIVFNLPYTENNLVPAGKFLQRYKSLLKSLGAEEVKNAKMIAQDEESAEKKLGLLRKTYDEMRQGQELTDFKFQLQFQVDSDAERKLWAHKSFLAASIPHLKDALTGTWAESRDATSYRFDGSYFQAKAVLDFVYTGEIFDESEKMSLDNIEGREEILSHVLEMLDTAEDWNMKDLKRKVEKIIIEEFKLISPYTCRRILKAAIQFNAQALKQSCEQWIEENSGFSMFEDDE